MGFREVTKVKPAERGKSDYFEPDHTWAVLIDTCRQNKTVRTQKDFFAVDAKVLESSCPEVHPGAERAFYRDWGAFPEATDKDIAQFFDAVYLAAAGERYDWDGTTSYQADLTNMVGVDQPFCGTILRLRTRHNDAKTFTKYWWSAPEGAEKVRLEKLAQSLGIMATKTAVEKAVKK